MGVCQSTEIQTAQKRHQSIERSLKKNETILVQKLLLLGPGESGKSTVLKQMIILHKDGFTHDELNDRRSVIYSNTIASMCTILQAMDVLDIVLTDGLQSHAKRVNAMAMECKVVDRLEGDVLVAIRTLWADATVQTCFGRRSEYQLNDSSKYFLDALERLSAPDYCPSEEDMLHARVATTGVVEVAFTIKDIDFRVFDVGGQRSERRKWIHCFDDVHGIIFVAAVSEYDQLLREDQHTNRVKEALALFKTICNSEFFFKTSMILFLNKTDLFREKIQRVTLKSLFPDYKGGLNYEDGILFLRKKFTSQKEDEKKKLFIHETCATDTNQVKIVIRSVISTVIDENLKESGMV